jgi:hypothetical protein
LLSKQVGGPIGRLSDLELLNSRINRAHLLAQFFHQFCGYRRVGWAQGCFKKRFWWATAFAAYADA